MYQGLMLDGIIRKYTLMIFQWSNFIKRGWNYV